MKYRILPLEIVQMVVDFLDDVQLEAAEEDDIVLVKHLQSLITELINSEEIFDNEEEALNHYKKGKSKNKSEKYEFWNLSKKDLIKLSKYFDEIAHQTDRTKRKKYAEDTKNKGKKSKEIKLDSMSLKDIKLFLLQDPELTDEERFELYYQEYDRLQREKRIKKAEKDSIPYGKMLKDLGIKRYDEK